MPKSKSIPGQPPLKRGRKAVRQHTQLALARIANVKKRMDNAIRGQYQISASDIEVILGGMHDCKNPARRESCRMDLARFLQVYRPRTFYRPFSKKHLAFIKQLEEAMLESLWIVKSVFRGFGKTTITEGACEWALLYGHKRFVRIIAASGVLAENILKSVREDLETNSLLFDDFPEVCFAARALEGKFQRAGMQSFRGNLTGIQWTGSQTILPTTIEDAPSAGSVIDAVGWTAGIRGARHRTRGGETIRPDFIMVDDPQDDEMAGSPATCQKFLDILQGSILGLGGHDARISVVIPATIIKVGDAIDQLMDPKEYPAWIAENVPMLEVEPADDSLWMGEYARLRSDYDRDDPKSQARAHKAATAFYKANRAAMDAGAVVTWDECKQKDEISALQHAMNIRIDRGEEYFLAECQGRPTQRLGSGALVTSQDFIAGKLSGTPQRMTAPDHQVVVGFVDVSHTKLQWMMCGWRFDFTGSVLDYGEWPEGSKSLGDVDPRLHAAVHQGLMSLIETIAGNPISCAVPGAAERTRIGSILVDCGDPTTRDGVFSVTRAARFPCRVIASRGRAHHQFYLGDPKKKRPLQNGFIDIWKGCGPVLVHDACLWRERCQRAFMLPPGSIGGIDVYGSGKMRHRELAIQICSERLVEKLAGMSGEMFKWNRVPGTRNHFLDCAVGCMVAATMEGLRYGNEEQGGAPRAKRTRRSSHDEGGSGGEPSPRRRGGFRSLED